MAVPAEIRAVPRPKNTVVEDSGRNGPKRYAVRERKTEKYIRGGNPQPRNGKVIGHIIDFKYVPCIPEASEKKVEPDMLSYGSSALFRSVVEDIKDDLLAVFDPVDAFTILAVAGLRVTRPSISVNRMSAHFYRSFLCKYFEGASISKNSVGNLFEKIGMDSTKREAFFQRRMQATMETHHIAIDGTLKQDTSRVNDLSAYSHKSRVRGCGDISVLYAYDIERMEPICAEVFPGNCIDASSYSAFIRDNDIQKGLIIADKGFPPSKIEGELSQRPDLHFLTPIKRNDVRIANNNMLSYEGTLEGVAAHILYKKAKIQGGRYLYAFKDARKAALEETAFIESSKKSGEFSNEKYAKKKDLFGVIVFESDVDLEPKTAYICYEERWNLELVFRAYKSNEQLDETRQQNDFTVIGSEFVNTIATIATCRIIKKAEQTGLLDHMTYAELMDDLSSAWRKSDAPEKAVTNDEYWVHTLKSVHEELETLGLSEPVPKQHKKRGRKSKNCTSE